MGVKLWDYTGHLKVDIICKSEDGAQEMITE